MTLARHLDRSPRSRSWHRRLRRSLSRDLHACVRRVSSEISSISRHSGRKGGSLRCEHRVVFVQSGASRQYRVVAVKQCRSTYIYRSTSRRRVCLSVWLVPSLRLLMYVIARSNHAKRHSVRPNGRICQSLLASSWEEAPFPLGTARVATICTACFSTSTVIECHPSTLSLILSLPSSPLPCGP